jgi:hypothetical protein
MFWECCSPGFLKTVNNSVGVKVDTNRPLEEVLELIERYLRSLQSRHMDMRDLLAVRQGEGQSYTSLGNEIRELADYADTAHITEDLLLIGILLKAMRREEDKAKTMQKNPATFDNALKFILELETARQDARAIGGSGQRSSVDEFDVDFVRNQSSYKKLRLYLRGKPFELVVDHKPLVPILNHKQLEDIATPRILRLKEKLAEFVLTAVWRPGASMTVVDAFSRYPTSAPSASDLEVLRTSSCLARQNNITTPMHV